MRMNTNEDYKVLSSPSKLADCKYYQPKLLEESRKVRFSHHDDNGGGSDFNMKVSII